MDSGTTRTEENIRIAIGCLVGLLGLLVFSHVATYYIPLGSDFAPDYASGIMLLSGKSVYGHVISEIVHNRTGQGGYENFHPPFSALLFAPLALFPYFYAHLFFNGISLLSFLGLLYVSRLIVPLPRGSWIMIGGMTFFWHPFIETIALGQISAVLALLITAGWYFLRHNYQKYAGILFGIAALLKVFPLLLFLPLIVGKKWRAATAMGATLGAGVLAFLLLGRWDDIALFFGNIAPRNSNLWAFFPPNGSLRGLILPFFLVTPWSIPPVDSPEIGTYALMGTQAVFIGVSLFALSRAKRVSRSVPEVVDCLIGVTIPMMLLLSPISWPHNIVLLVPVLASFAREISLVKRLIGVIVLLLFSLPEYDIMREMQQIYQSSSIPWSGFLLVKGAALGYLAIWILAVVRAVEKPMGKNITLS